MADLPILFSAPMVRALIDGTKTQTRRIAPTPKFEPHGCHNARMGGRNDWFDYWRSDQSETHRFRTKYAVGDRLYVREHWRVSQRWDGTAPRDLKPKTMTVFFAAGGSIANQDEPGDWKPADWPEVGLAPAWVGKLRQAMHMPKWASRITLVVEDVRIERLEDITEADAIAEGVAADRDGWKQYGTVGTDPAAVWATATDAYHDLWDSINGIGAWDENPWVVAYTFRRIMGNIDTIEASL